jgi:iron(III) transport system permease protein
MRAYPTGIAVFAVLVTLLALVPMFFVAGSAIEVGLREAQRLLIRPRVGELLRNTASLTAATLLLCSGLGIGAAWLVERTTLPGRRIWHVLLAAPLAVPSFVNSYGWVSMSTGVQGYRGALIVVTLSYFPLVYLPVAATLRGLDPALEESARALGHGPWRAFARVVVPQLRPALFGGALLVGLHLLAEFGALQMMRFPTFTTAIYDQYQATFGGPAANMLAGVLAVCCLLFLLAELRLRGAARYARVGAGTARQPARVRLGRYTPFAVAALLALVAAALGVPLGSLGYWLTVGASTAFPVHELTTAALSSIGLGAAGAALTTALALPVAWLSVRHRGRFADLVERATYFGNALPGIVVALSLVTLSIRYAKPVYQTTVLLLAAYTVLFLPRAMVTLRAALAQAPPNLDEAARALGTGRLGVLRRVTLPLIAPGLGTAAAMVFLAVVTELTATLLLAPIGTTTLATQFWSNSDSIAYGAAAPYATLMIAISMPASYLLTHAARRTDR